MNFADEPGPPTEETSSLSAESPPLRPARKRAIRERKIVFTIPEAVYQKLAVWCYERGKRVEQVAEELLLAKFAE